MSACGVTEMQQTSCGTFYGDLEEYLSEVEKRAQRTATETDDVYSQLALREKDLVLAAELGKALLEKNEEISRANERLAEEYSHKLEVCLFFYMSYHIFLVYYIVILKQALF